MNYRTPDIKLFPESSNQLRLPPRKNGLPVSHCQEAWQALIICILFEVCIYSSKLAEFVKWSCPQDVELILIPLDNEIMKNREPPTDASKVGLRNL